jgi:hypothetical protein
MSQAERNQRRLNKKGQLKAVEKMNQSPVHQPEAPHLRALELNLEKLGDAFNHNIQLFSHTLSISEMRMNVLQRVINDQLIGEAHTTQIERIKWTEEWVMAPDGSVKSADVPVKEMVIAVDYTWYTTYFMCCMVMVEFATWLNTIYVENREEKSGPGSILSIPDYGDAQVFGGSP